MNPTDLWPFALACYARPGVEAACLELQAAGADVCVLLTGAWLERRGISYSAQRLVQLEEVSAQWRTQVVIPLRQLRTGWRAAAADDKELAALREAIKSLELEAERTQLGRLAAQAQTWANTGEGADWLDHLCAGLAGEPRTQMDIMRRAALAQLDEEDGV